MCHQVSDPLASELAELGSTLLAGNTPDFEGEGGWCTTVDSGDGEPAVMGGSGGGCGRKGVRGGDGSTGGGGEVWGGVGGVEGVICSLLACT